MEVVDGEIDGYIVDTSGRVTGDTVGTVLLVLLAALLARLWMQQASYLKTLAGLLMILL